MCYKQFSRTLTPEEVERILAADAKKEPNGQRDSETGRVLPSEEKLDKLVELIRKT